MKGVVIQMIVINIILSMLYTVSLYMLCKLAYEKGFMDSARTARAISDELIRQYELPKDCFVETAKKLAREAKKIEGLKDE